MDSSVAVAVRDMPARTLYFGERSLRANPGSFQAEEHAYDPAKDTKIPAALTKGALGEGDTKLTTEELKAPGAAYFYTRPFTKATAVTGPVR